MPDDTSGAPAARIGPDTLRRAPRELATARLQLQMPRIEHAPAFADSLNASLPDWRYVGWAQQACSLAWAQQFCVRGGQLIEDGECLIYNAFEMETGAFVGRIDLHTIDWEGPRGEIGYVGDPRLAGRGLMREAVLGLVDVAFKLGFVRIEAMSDARNERALHFAQCLGFQREGLLHRHERDPQGALCDMVLFACWRDAPTDPGAA